VHATHPPAQEVLTLQAISLENVFNTMESSNSGPDAGTNAPPAESKTSWKIRGAPDDSSTFSVDDPSRDDQMAADTKVFELAHDAEVVESKLKYGKDAEFLQTDKRQASARLKQRYCRVVADQRQSHELTSALL